MVETVELYRPPSQTQNVRGSRYSEACLDEMAAMDDVFVYNAALDRRMAEFKDRGPEKTGDSFDQIELERVMLNRFVGQHGYINHRDFYNEATAAYYDSATILAARVSFTNMLTLETKTLGL